MTGSDSHTLTATQHAHTERLTPYLSIDERVARGREARRRTPRGVQATFRPPGDRFDPIDVLESQSATRVPELVPIRYGRMLVSPFTFYRGAAAIMARDLADTSSTGFRVQCCGDAHLSNFGAFASPERRLVFDINDFDETLPGPWEWDVKRLAVSILIAARDNGYPIREQERAVLDTVTAYRTAMAGFAKLGNLDVWYSHLELDKVLADNAVGLRPKQVRRTEAAMDKARTKDSSAVLAKLTRNVDGQPRIIDQPPLIVPVEAYSSLDREQIIEWLKQLLRHYRTTLEFSRRLLLEKYEIVDFALKVVGVGSVGTRAYIALLIGRDGRDPLFLQAKEADVSVLEEFVGHSGFANHGERVVTGQRTMQAFSDIFLGWLRVDAGLDGQTRDFYLRQLKDWKASVEVEELQPTGFRAYGRLCGWTLARAHARSGDRVAIAAYLGGSDRFDRAILEFSEAYAEQNDRDYQALVAAVKSGRIKAQTGV